MAKNSFTFSIDGADYSIPKFSDLPMGVLRRSRHATDEMDKVFIIIEEVMGTDSPEIHAIDSMNAVEFAEFLSEWTGGVPVGESSSSES
jgi:hypothetical protein